ncbi:DUF305 domain-containing protein [Streptomyces roseirectus]|uniref:DUF305 domain-containing protein n=1 Tax=Streptomyces roseirectus TaxID=2768066 RepID=A0A7H0IJQ7_9ACTN|nr:DUF305 domain-containing protein [Streptomyces roseirectus]QNP73023.1 DUF305 domain-containing protein [Streptomyces roseirectus]
MSAATSSTRLSRALIGGALVALLAAVALTVTFLRPAQANAPVGPVDSGFARDMAVHHQQAVEMSFIVRDRTTDVDVRRLAYDIINTQANQRGMLLGWLDTWNEPKSSQASPMSWMGHPAYPAHDGSLMPGMATNTQLNKLRSLSGTQAETYYLTLMTAHHKGGIDMAQGAAQSAETEQVRRLAQGMVNGQKAELSLMADMLKKRS